MMMNSTMTRVICNHQCFVWEYKVYDLNIYCANDKRLSTIYKMKFMEKTSLQHYKPSTIKYVLHVCINISFDSKMYYIDQLKYLTDFMNAQEWAEVSAKH
jgi:hypothetical protein